jgi:hypothetical protein
LIHGYFYAESGRWHRAKCCDPNHIDEKDSTTSTFSLLHRKPICPPCAALSHNTLMTHEQAARQYPLSRHDLQKLPWVKLRPLHQWGNVNATSSYVCLKSDVQRESINLIGSLENAAQDAYKRAPDNASETVDKHGPDSATYPWNMLTCFKDSYDKRYYGVMDVDEVEAETEVTEVSIIRGHHHSIAVWGGSNGSRKRKWHEIRSRERPILKQCFTCAKMLPESSFSVWSWRRVGEKERECEQCQCTWPCGGPICNGTRQPSDAFSTRKWTRRRSTLFRTWCLSCLESEANNDE